MLSPTFILRGRWLVLKPMCCPLLLATEQRCVRASSLMQALKYYTGLRLWGSFNLQKQFWCNLLHVSGNTTDNRITYSLFSSGRRIGFFSIEIGLRIQEQQIDYTRYVYIHTLYFKQELFLSQLNFPMNCDIELKHMCWSVHVPLTFFPLKVKLQI